MARFAAVLLLVLTVTTAGAASEPAVPLPAGLALDAEARVAEVIDGSTVLLDDGETVRLAGIEALAERASRYLVASPLSRAGRQRGRRQAPQL